jgi:hypothetical protein
VELDDVSGQRRNVDDQEAGVMFAGMMRGKMPRGKDIRDKEASLR